MNQCMVLFICHCKTPFNSKKPLIYYHLQYYYQIVTKECSKYYEFIKKETLAINISVKEGINNSYDLNGHEVFIETEKR